MAKHTNAEQEHHAGPTEITDAELDQVCGGQGAVVFFAFERVNNDPAPETITTPRGQLIIPGEGVITSPG